MFDLIARLLAWLYDLWPSYGGAIILLTLVVMLVTTPLTIKGTRSMIQMQRLQPELKAIQERYRNDRQKMNEELMAFYQANNINPLGGCFPLLVQLPVFIVLYQVLNGLTRRNTDIGQQLGWTVWSQFTDQTSTDVVAEARNFNPAYLDQSTELYDQLHRANDMRFVGIDLARSARDVLGDSFTTAIPYLLMIIVVGVTTYLNQRQIQGRSTAQANPQQQLLLKVMPFFLPVISFSLQASLVVYFLVSNLYRYAQQAYITRALYGKDDDAPPVVIPAKSAPAKKAKGKTTAKPNAAKQQAGKGRTETKEPARARRKSFGDRPTPNKRSKPAGGSTSTPSRVTPKGGVQPRARKTKKRK